MAFLSRRGMSFVRYCAASLAVVIESVVGYTQWVSIYDGLLSNMGMKTANHECTSCHMGAVLASIKEDWSIALSGFLR